MSNKEYPISTVVDHGASAADARHGAILVVVLWAALGLVTLSLYFGHAMQLAYRAVDNEMAGRQAELAVESGARYAAFLLGTLEDPKQLPLLEDYVYEDVPVGEAGFWFLGRDDDALLYDTPAFGLIDEASKLNLNTAPRTVLEKLPDMPVEFAAAIVDWRDEDEEVTENGAEAQTYSLLDPPTFCKNAPFETVEELLLVYGADWDLLYGEDANRNGALDPNEDDGDQSDPLDDADGTLDPGLLAYLTVYTREPNVLADGTARINVSGESEELGNLLRETFGEERGNEILAGGQGGESNSLIQYFIRSGMTADEFDQVAHLLTVSDEEEEYSEGLVNVNTADEAVLACLPGLDEEKAAQLVAQRRTQATPPASEAWIVEVLGNEAAAQVGPYVTARCYQVTADVAAVGRHGRGFRRTRFVIDAATDTPRVVYRKDLDGLGWALGLDWYDLLAGEEEGIL